MSIEECVGLHGLHCHLTQQNSEAGIGSSVGKEVHHYSIRETPISNLRTTANNERLWNIFLLSLAQDTTNINTLIWGTQGDANSCPACQDHPSFMDHEALLP
jgi:hypothetical protein